MEARRQEIVAESVVRVRRAYDMESLLTCLVYSMCLMGATEVFESLVLAIDITTKYPALHYHIQSLLQLDHAVPGRSTLYRHRLMLHMGTCLVMQTETDAVSV